MTEAELAAPPGTTETVLDGVVPRPTKTPLFQAVHAARYQRQAIIRQIQQSTGRRLICYVSGDKCAVHREDAVPFVDLLHNVPAEADLDLLLHTAGGDIDAAEKLISMVRTKVGTGILRVVVPDYAKSAGTLMALGADLIVMSDTSELGPIDPQIYLSDGNGNRILHPVQAYLDAYAEHCTTLKSDPDNVAAKIMLSKMDPATIKMFEAVMARARTLAEGQLKRGMLSEGNWTLATAALFDKARWRSHGQMISWKDAQHENMGLTVEYLEQSSELWQQYWQLYCLQQLAIEPQQKLYESDYASLVMEGAGA